MHIWEDPTICTQEWCFIKVISLILLSLKVGIPASPMGKIMFLSFLFLCVFNKSDLFDIVVSQY